MGRRLLDDRIKGLLGIAEKLKLRGATEEKEEVARRWDHHGQVAEQWVNQVSPVVRGVVEWMGHFLEVGA